MPFSSSSKASIRRNYFPRPWLCGTSSAGGVGAIWLVTKPNLNFLLQHAFASFSIQLFYIVVFSETSHNDAMGKPRMTRLSPDSLICRQGFSISKPLLINFRVCLFGRCRKQIRSIAIRQHTLFIALYDISKMLKWQLNCFLPTVLWVFFVDCVEINSSPQ